MKKVQKTDLLDRQTDRQTEGRSAILKSPFSFAGMGLIKTHSTEMLYMLHLQSYVTS